MHPLINRLAKLEAQAAPAGPLVEFILPNSVSLAGEFAPNPNAMATFRHA